MTVVADSSVLVAALIGSGFGGEWAESAIAADHLAAPELALVEAANILRRMERGDEIFRLEASTSHH